MTSNIIILLLVLLLPFLSNSLKSLYSNKRFFVTRQLYAVSEKEGKNIDIYEYDNPLTKVLSQFLPSSRIDPPSSPATGTISKDKGSLNINWNMPKRLKKPIGIFAKQLSEKLTEKGWFVTGNVDPSFFSDSFQFKDPDVQLKGIEPYARGVNRLFDQKTSRAEIVDVKVSAEDLITVTWRLSGAVNLFGKSLTIKPYVVYTDLKVDPVSGLIDYQEDRFSIPGYDILLSALLPNFLTSTFLTPPAPPIEELKQQQQISNIELSDKKKISPSIVKSKISGKDTTTTNNSVFDDENRDAQSLTFIEPSTGTKVILIGSMHYNPVSIKLAERTVRQAIASGDGDSDSKGKGKGKGKGKLAAVVVESCPTRWNKPVPDLVKLLLPNEMRAAADVAAESKVPVILGDQTIELTNKRLQESFTESITDIFTPNRWGSFVSAIRKAISETLPSSSPQMAYLTSRDFLDPALLLAAPISLIRYPASFLVKAPQLGIPLLLIAFSPMPFDSSANPDVTMLSGLDDAGVPSWLLQQTEDVLSSALIFIAEVALLARPFLIGLLAERNEVLAASILEQCVLAASSEKSSGRKAISSSSSSSSSSEGSDKPWFGWWSNDKGKTEKTNPVTSIKKEEENEKIVIAILGMAHCNGVKKILMEKASSNSR